MLSEKIENLLFRTTDGSDATFELVGLLDSREPKRFGLSRYEFPGKAKVMPRDAGMSYYDCRLSRFSRDLVEPMNAGNQRRYFTKV